MNGMNKNLVVVVCVATIVIAILDLTGLTNWPLYDQTRHFMYIGAGVSVFMLGRILVDKTKKAKE